MTSSIDWDLWLDNAVAVARAAGDLLLERLAQIDTSRTQAIVTKSSAVDLVTEADRAAEALIVEQLARTFPDHGRIGEEGEESAADARYVWHIDPLDGTNNFAHGLPHFSVSLALTDRNRPVLGVVHDPGRNETFAAVAGRGAQLRTGQSRRPLRVSQTPDLVHSMVATGFPYDRHSSERDNIAQLGAFIKRVQGIRRNGSAALDLAYVAAGRFDAYWEYKLGHYDVAAGVLLVQEAGGRVTHIDGAPVQLTPKLDLVASNGHVHGAMLDVLFEIDG